MNNLKEIAIGVFTGLLLTIFMFAMITEARTTTGLIGSTEEEKRA